MDRPIVRKAVCYIVRGGRLLVFTHLDVPLEETGVQVPAGTIRPGEEPAAAALREAREETGLTGLRVIRPLGEARYDLSPMRDEIAVRHFFLLESHGPVQERWQSGEDDPEHGGDPVRWECWWMPLAQAHGLAGGLGALLGEI